MTSRRSTAQAEDRLALVNAGQLDIGATPRCPFVPGQPPAQQLGGLAAAGGPGRAVTGVSEGLGNPVRRRVVAKRLAGRLAGVEALEGQMEDRRSGLLAQPAAAG